MLARKYRLVGQNNFKKIARQGKYFFLKEIGIKWLPNKSTNSRFAFVVSSQIDKKAVVRNKIKRRLRAIVYQRIKRIKPGFDVLFLTRPAIKNLEFNDLENKLNQLLSKAGLL